MTRRTLLSLALATLLLAAAPPARSAPAEGSGILEGKNVAGLQLQIDGNLYLLSPTAVLRLADGTALTLGSLPAPPIGGSASGLWPLLRASWSGQTTSLGTVIDSIVLEPTHD